MGSLKFGVNDNTQNNSGHIKITTAVGKNSVSAFAKSSPIDGEENHSRRSSGVFVAESEGSLITDKTIVIEGDRFLVNDQKVDSWGVNYLVFLIPEIVAVWILAHQKY